MKVDRFDVETGRRMAVLTESDFRHILVWAEAQVDPWIKHLQNGGDYTDYRSFYRLHPEEDAQ